MIKNFLKENKIYFEILSSVLLAGMAIIVSLQANSISKSQLDLAEKAQEISMLPHVPFVKAYFKYVETDIGERREDLIIANEGEALYELEVLPMAFLNLTELEVIHLDKESSNDFEPFGATFPIKSYFPNVIYGLNGNKGILQRREIPNTKSLDSELKKFEDLYSNDEKSINAQIERYLAVSYKDKFGTKHKKYFKFGFGGDSSPIAVSEGENLVSEFYRMRKTGELLDFKTSKAKDINELWLKHKQKI
nr:hypothetical protein [uncultured Shewanella sp.]